jgi:hypothetical protein
VSADVDSSITRPMCAGSMWMTADISAMVKDVTHSAPGASSPGLLGMFQDLPSWVLSRLQGNEEAMAGAKTWLAAGAMRVPELCFGLTYAMVATQLILAHMVRELAGTALCWGCQTTARCHSAHIAEADVDTVCAGYSIIM